MDKLFQNCRSKYTYIYITIYICWIMHIHYIYACICIMYNAFICICIDTYISLQIWKSDVNFCPAVSCLHSTRKRVCAIFFFILICLPKWNFNLCVFHTGANVMTCLWKIGYRWQVQAVICFLLQICEHPVLFTPIVMLLLWKASAWHGKKKEQFLLPIAKGSFGWEEQFS